MLTRGTCFVASRLDLAAVAVLLCFCKFALNAARFCFFPNFFNPHANGLRALHVPSSLASFTSLLVGGKNKL